MRRLLLYWWWFEIFELLKWESLEKAWDEGGGGGRTKEGAAVEGLDMFDFESFNFWVELVLGILIECKMFFMPNVLLSLVFIT